MSETATYLAIAFAAFAAGAASMAIARAIVFGQRDPFKAYEREQRRKMRTDPGGWDWFATIEGFRPSKPYRGRK